MPTEQAGVDRDAISHRYMPDIAADREDLTGEFMTWDQRIGRRREMAVDDVQIGAANTDGAGTNDDFTGFGGRVWQGLDADGPRRADYGSTHHVLLTIWYI